MSGVGHNDYYIEEKAQQILKICNSIHLDEAPEREFSCSIGIARLPNDGKTYAELYKKADEAMYSVKKSGKNNYAFFEQENT